MLLLLGLSLAIVGGIMLLLGRSGISTLPGDIRVQSQGWGCYVPIVASIILSIALTIVLNLLIRFFR
jgi:uncharacterized membrane-anchored protein